MLFEATKRWQPAEVRHVRRLLLGVLIVAACTAVPRRAATDAESVAVDYEALVRSRQTNIAARELIGEALPGIHAGTRWISHGPENLSGVTFSFLTDPENPNVFLSGTFESLWRTTDAGATWSSIPTFDGLLVSALARDPRNHDIVYAGTGLGFGADGVYRSLDRGATWQKLPGSRVNGTIASIAVSPASSQVILLGTDNGVFRSTDAGATWRSILPGGSLTRVLFDPADGTRAIAAMTPNGPPWVGARVYWSIDGGATWTAAAGVDDPQGNGVAVAYAPSNRQRVYLAVTTPSAEVNIWRSEDGGHSYARMSHNTSILGGGLGANLFVSPADQNVIVFGGVDLRTSFNGGVTLNRITLTVDAANHALSYPHLDIHGIAAAAGFNGTTNRRVLVWTDGGVFRTDDVAAGPWTPLFNKHQSATVYSIDVSSRGTIAAGMQDTGISVTPASSTITQHVSDGDITNIVFDPTNDSRFFVSQFGVVARSDDLSRQIDLLAGQPLQFRVPAVIDPNNASRMFAAAYEVARIDNLQGTMAVTKIRPSNGQHIGAIAVQRGDSNVVYIVDDANMVYKTANALAAAPTWTALGQVTTANLPQRLIIDRDDPNTMYLASLNGLAKSTDGGAHWLSAMGTSGLMLPQWVSDVVEHPARHDWLFAGTAAGLYVSYDGGARWYLPAGPVVPLQLDVRSVVFQPGTNVLFLGTYGRGVWSAEVPPTGTVPRHRSAKH